MLAGSEMVSGRKLSQFRWKWWEGTTAWSPRKDAFQEADGTNIICPAQVSQQVPTQPQKDQKSGKESTKSYKKSWPQIKGQGNTSTTETTEVLLGGWGVAQS